MTHEEINVLINKIISSGIAEKDDDLRSICGEWGLKKDVLVVKGENLELKYFDEPSNLMCEVRKMDNENPVVYRDKDGNIYRLNGEFYSILDELIRLSSL